MREIKFRGRTLDGLWVYGYISCISKGLSSLNNIEPGYYISNYAGSPCGYAIRSETIGQYTGLKDKNGKEIYESDFLRWMSPLPAEPYSGEQEIIVIIDRVIWDNGGYFFDDFEMRQIDTESDCEIVGNIYEDTELMEKINESK